MSKFLPVISLVFMALVSLPVRPDVTEQPPPLSELSGSYIGSVAGSTLQRLVLLPDGSGFFTDVWFDSTGHHAMSYRLHVDSYKGWHIAMGFTSFDSPSKSVRASGDAGFFVMNLELGATPQYRKRSVTLFREETFRSMLDFAHKVSPAPSEEEP